jgi:uncharacterized protein (DUF1778 family)
MQTTDAETNRSDRIELRATPHEKAMLIRAAALEHLDLTSFVMRSAVPAAHAVIERAERVALSERDTLLVLKLLENPPPPNTRLTTAAQAWGDNRQRQLADE